MGQPVPGTVFLESFSRDAFFHQYFYFQDTKPNIFFFANLNHATSLYEEKGEEVSTVRTVQQ
jgi:hypothetical protein